MELRHLRFSVAIVEEGSFTTAAERRLHTAQPSLSRQIRDLEYEVGTPLLVRSARGVEPTAAGRAFLDRAIGKGIYPRLLHGQTGSQRRGLRSRCVAPAT